MSTISPTVCAGASLRILILDASGDPPDCCGQLIQAGIVARSTFISSPNSIEHELQKGSYNLLLWKLSPKQDLEALRDFLGRADSIPPLIVIASRETHNSATEAGLLELMGEGIRDFCFEDEPAALLRRSVQKILIEQADYGNLGRAQVVEHSIAAEQALTALLDACPLAVVALTPAGAVSLWNRSAEKTYGWRREEVIGKPLPTIPAGGEYEFRLLLESQLHGISRAGKEVRRQRKDGTVIDVTLWTAPLRDRHGRIRGKLAISADVTERHRAEREYLQLLESQRETRQRVQVMERFQTLLEAAPDAIIEVDAAGKIILLNAATEQLFGYSKKELFGQSVDSLVPDQVRDRHRIHRGRYTADPVTRPMGSGLDLHGQRKDGSQFPVEISLSPIRSDGEFHVMAIVRDVSERKRADQQIREIQDQFAAELASANHQLEIRNREIEEANRHKSEFLASMSHELRTPLHTIIGFAQLLTEELEGPLTAKQKRFLGHIHRDSLHLLGLINGILDISKIEAGKLELHPENFNPFDTLSDVLTSIAPLAATKSIALDTKLCGPFTLRADRLRFRQIVYNLLSNAVKFTPAGGRISVECSLTDSHAQFCIRDTGVGIPENEQLSVFDKFHQVSAASKAPSEGTGLGLAITKHLVEQQGGRIWLESEPGIGSRFYFTVPL